MNHKNIKDFIHYHVKIPIQNLIIDHGTQSMKRWWLKRYSGWCGNNVTVGPKARFFTLNNIYIGKNTSIGDGCKIYSSDERIVSIGTNCLLAPDVTILCSNHNFMNKGVLIRDQGQTSNNTTIGNDCWIATRVIILPGVNLGTGCVVGAGAVVTKSFEPYNVVAGVPAKVIDERE